MREEVADFGGELRLVHGAEGDLAGLRAREGEFGLCGEEEVGELARVRRVRCAADDGDGVWDAKRLSVFELHGAHGHGFAFVFCLEEIIGVGERRVAHAAGHGVLRVGVARHFAQAAAATSACHCCKRAAPHSCQSTV